MKETVPEQVQNILIRGAWIRAYLPSRSTKHVFIKKEKGWNVYLLISGRKPTLMGESIDSLTAYLWIQRYMKDIQAFMLYDGRKHIRQFLYVAPF